MGIENINWEVAGAFKGIDRIGYFEDFVKFRLLIVCEKYIRFKVKR